MIDADPQGSMTISLGYQVPDELDNTLADLMTAIVNDELLNNIKCAITYIVVRQIKWVSNRQIKWS